MAIETKGICDVCKAPINMGAGYGLVKYQSLTGLAFRIVKGIGGGDQEDHYCGKEHLIRRLSEEIDGITENVIGIETKSDGSSFQDAARQNGGTHYGIVG